MNVPQPLQVLVTDHVGLALPGAYYLVHMVGGVIVTQRTIADPRANEPLDGVAQKGSPWIHI